jgi:hypothetical protein
MELRKFIATTIREYLNENNYLSNKVYNNIETIDSDDKDEILKHSIDWAVNLIYKKLGIKPKFNIKWGNTSNTFENSIEIKFKEPYHFKYKEDFYDTILHELCHVVDNTFGSSSSKFGDKILRPISDSVEWKKIPLKTAPTTYAKDSKDEDFVISLQYALYDRLNELTEDRIVFIKNKFPKLM